MDESTRFLILSLGNESYGLPITKLLEISGRRDIQKDSKLTELFEGRINYRGKLIPVLNLRKILKLSGGPGGALLIIQSAKGILGLLADSVVEIVDVVQQPVPLPRGVMNPSFQYYSGIVRYKENIVLLLNEDGLLP